MNYLEWKKHILIFRYMHAINYLAAIPEELEMAIYCKYKAVCADGLPASITLIAGEQTTAEDIASCLVLATKATSTTGAKTTEKVVDLRTNVIEVEAGKAGGKVEAATVQARLDAIKQTLINRIIKTTTTVQPDDVLIEVAKYRRGISEKAEIITASIPMENAKFSSTAMFLTNIAALQLVPALVTGTIAETLKSKTKVTFSEQGIFDTGASIEEALKSEISVAFDATYYNAASGTITATLKSGITADISILRIDALQVAVATKFLSTSLTASVNNLTYYDLAIDLSAVLGDTATVNISEQALDAFKAQIQTVFADELTAAPSSMGMDGVSAAFDGTTRKVTANPSIVTFDALGYSAEANIKTAATVSMLYKAAVVDFAGKSVSSLSGVSVESAAYIEK